MVIGGATATGKTAMSIRIAEQLKCPVLSADSRQCYREMNIGTAKPSQKELSAVPHLFINNLSIHESSSVGRFEREAMDALDNIYREHSIAVLSGGTGLYIKAVCEGLDDFPDVPLKVVEDLNKKFQKEGIAYLQEQLRIKDPRYSREVDLDNPHRLIRALSVIETSGLPFSHYTRKNKTVRPFKPVFICLQLPRQLLYRRIEERVDEMVRQGLEEEARSLFSFRHLRSLQTVGYQEWFACIEGKISRQEAIEKIKQHTRNFAKRQLTWFRNQGGWTFFNPKDTQRISEFIAERTGIDTDLSEN